MIKYENMYACGVAFYLLLLLFSLLAVISHMQAIQQEQQQIQILCALQNWFRPAYKKNRTICAQQKITKRREKKIIIDEKKRVWTFGNTNFSM